MRRDRTFLSWLSKRWQHLRSEDWHQLWGQLWQQPSLRLARRGLLLVVAGWLIVTAIALVQSAMQPIDTRLVLGGSIRRELYAAEVSIQQPEVPILISKGSEAPCIRKIFERDQAPIHRIWLEECADSTFGNFYFSLPILQAWNVRHVEVITSPTHLPRALWLARIMLGSHGIWVTPNLVKETGVPGNQEAWWKTILDVGRGSLWVIPSLFYQPQCDNVIPLSQVDISQWENQPVDCERQAELAP